LLYQTLLGAWPFGGPDEEFVRRICEFMLKALKEAKVHTSWITPNTDYEEAVLHFTRAILDPHESSAFLDDLDQLQRKVAWFGIFNSLSQTVLKLGSPGVADVYQGNELWDFSLVDPDNRRPVDFSQREDALRWILERADDRTKLASDLLESREDGRVKLYVTQRLLCLRREQPRLFVGASYTPLRGNPHVAAYARAAEGRQLVVAAPVQIATLLRGALVAPIGSDVWHDDQLVLSVEPGRSYRDVFTGRDLVTEEGEGRAILRLADVFAEFPVAALLSD
jgi:(1->4)-alpha-D-glucan 1-alpha-D-glucosylmutase